MDFENQFTRPMIHAMGTRMAILKMESVCDKPDAKFQQGFELGFAIQSLATVSEIANIIRDAQIKFRRDPSSKIDNSDLGKLYEGTVFDLAKYIVEHVNVKV